MELLYQGMGRTTQALVVTYNDAKRSRDSRIYSQVIIEWIPSDIQRHIIERHNHVKISSYLYNTFPSSQNQSQVNPKNFESMNPTHEGSPFPVKI